MGKKEEVLSETCTKDTRTKPNRSMTKGWGVVMAGVG